MQLWRVSPISGERMYTASLLKDSCLLKLAGARISMIFPVKKNFNFSCTGSVEFFWMVFSTAWKSETHGRSKIFLSRESSIACVLELVLTPCLLQSATGRNI